MAAESGETPRPEATDAAFDDLALLLLFLASWEEKGVIGRRAWKGLPFETLDALAERGYLQSSRGAKSVWLTPAGIARGRELERRFLQRGSAPGTAVPPHAGTVFELRVTLREIEPPIWRRVRVPADVELPALHTVLQHVMGWQDAHLHEFRAGGVSFGEPAEEDDHAPIDERRVRLSQLIRDPGDVLTYVYDFGDDWVHDIVLERSGRDLAAGETVTCLAGARACPPEDCGGVGGYANLLAALADPEDEEHARSRQWVGEEFDPEAFDLEAVNRALVRSWRRAPGSSRRPRR